MSAKNSRKRMKMRCDIWRAGTGETRGLYGRKTSGAPEEAITNEPCLIWVAEGSNPIITPDKEVVSVIFRGLFKVNSGIAELDEIRNIRNRRGDPIYDDICLRVNYCPPVFTEFVTVSLEKVS